MGPTDSRSECRRLQRPKARASHCTRLKPWKQSWYGPMNRARWASVQTSTYRIRALSVFARLKTTLLAASGITRKQLKAIVRKMMSNSTAVDQSDARVAAAVLQRLKLVGDRWSLPSVGSSLGALSTVVVRVPCPTRTVVIAALLNAGLVCFEIVSRKKVYGMARWRPDHRENHRNWSGKLVVRETGSPGKADRCDGWQCSATWHTSPSSQRARRSLTNV